jgi:tRNA 2-(methylsulfanyl)-N6-isopentenyladenosine37 hydroxylase
VSVPAQAALPTQILLAETPDSWVSAACARWPELLVDHLGCEKKAASTALALIFAYPEDDAMTLALSRLAREELRHFEQVQGLMRELAVPYARTKPGRYASGLRAVSRTSEPHRRLDLLLTGALIEARSAERFARLAPHLPAPLGRFYAQLQRSESRHFQLYLRLAVAYAGASGLDWRERLACLAHQEAQLVTRPDEQFRFHSGAPAAAAVVQGVT